MVNLNLEIKSNSVHLQQLLCGFIELHRRKVIKLNIDKKIINNDHFIKAKINGYTIIYDVADSGIVFDDLEIEGCDLYFKRSYDKKIIKEKLGEDALKKIKPLGLNYLVYSDSAMINGIKGKYIPKIKSLLKDRSNYKNYYTNDFECLPYYNKEFKIIYFTRVWCDKNAVIINNEYRDKLMNLNNKRANYIRACKKEFGEKFIGGLARDEFSEKYYNDCLASNQKLVKRGTFLNNIKKSNICIATTGLHKSIGWKMGEYVAASRAIVSERLCYEVPGDFLKDKNYLEFNNEDECLSSIYKLIDDKEYLREIMFNNWKYYHSYVQPEILIFNTIKDLI